MKNKDSDHDHLTKIYGYFDDVVEYVMCLGLNMEDAMDVAQEVLIKACRKHFQLREPNKLRAWIMKIAYRDALRYLKKRSKQWKHEISYIKDIETGEEIDVYDILPATKSAEECACDDEGEARLFDILETLNEKEYVIFVMHNVRGYKLREIAELLDIKESTARSIHSRTRKKLAAKIENLQRKED